MKTTVDLWSDMAMLVDPNQRIEATSVPLERITHAVIGRGADNVAYLELTLEDGTVLLFSRAGMTTRSPVVPTPKSDAIRKMFPNVEWRELRIAKRPHADAEGYMTLTRDEQAEAMRERASTTFDPDDIEETELSDRDWLDWADLQHAEARREVYDAEKEDK